MLNSNYTKTFYMYNIDAYGNNFILMIDIMMLFTWIQNTIYYLRRYLCGNMVCY